MLRKVGTGVRETRGWLEGTGGAQRAGAAAGGGTAAARTSTHLPGQSWQRWARMPMVGLSVL
jgi:hypothetical protein